MIGLITPQEVDCSEIDDFVLEGPGIFHSAHPHDPTLSYLCSSFSAEENITCVFICPRTFESGKLAQCSPHPDNNGSPRKGVMSGMPEEDSECQGPTAPPFSFP